MRRLNNDQTEHTNTANALGPNRFLLDADDPLEEIVADLQRYPAAEMILAMGLRLDALCEAHSEGEMRRVIQICGHCGLREPCQRNLKSCNRDADLIDECPLWDAGLLD